MNSCSRIRRNARTVAVVTGITGKWTKLRDVLLASLAISMVALTLLSYLSEVEYARCIKESATFCSKVSFTAPIIIVAFAMVATAVLGNRNYRPASSSHTA